MKYIMTLTRHDKSIVYKSFKARDRNEGFKTLEYFDDMFIPLMRTRLYSKITVKLKK